MKLKNFLNELAMKADTKIRFEKRKGIFNAQITLETGEKFNFNAETDKYAFDWHIVFSNDPDTERLKPNSKTGLHLFAAIEKIMNSFIIQENPDWFAFTGTGKSRIKLYNLLAKKIIKSGKYEVKKEIGLRSNQWVFEKI